MTMTMVKTKVPSEEPSIDLVDELYLRAIKDLIASQAMDTSMSVLVICGGNVDRDILLRVGLTAFVVSNLDENGAGKLGAKEWSYQDAEALTYPDNSFDFCFVHHGLHHCRSPHKAISEMLRVARRGTLIIEPADNSFTQLGVRLGFGQDYEHSAVYSHNYLFGGVRNSCVPNYIYRFTARELRKTVLCLEPTLKLRFKFTYGLQIPWKLLQMRKSGVKKIATTLAAPVFLLARALMPKALSNQIIAVVLRPLDADGLHPWLVQESDKISPNKTWFSARYGKKNAGND